MFAVINGDTGRAVVVRANNSNEALENTAQFLKNSTRSFVGELAVLEPFVEDTRPYGQVFGDDG
jgi:hypothetical protein